MRMYETTYKVNAVKKAKKTGKEEDESWEMTLCHRAVLVQMRDTTAYLYAAGREKKKDQVFKKS